MRIKEIIDKFRIYGVRRFFSYFLIEIRNKVFMQLIKGSYSQHGEDLVIDKLLDYKKNGFYVDVGAHDPHRFSNTKRFYKRNWNGINIEPDKKNYNKFVYDRKRDINLNIGIGETNSMINFYKFTPDTLSTFSEEGAENYKRQGYKFEGIEEIQTKRLEELLAEFCISKKIDFMSIDTEGFDMQVLKSNNWERFKPQLICIESHRHGTMVENNEKEINEYDRYLIAHGYRLIYNNGLNSIYKNVV